MKKLQELYDTEKIVNAKFATKYDYNDPNIMNQHILELIIEFSELAYETKCFKYWKNDKVDKDKILAEYSDCIMITLSFCDFVNLDIEDIDNVECNETNVIKQFIYLYNLTSKLTPNLDKIIIRDILANLLHLGKLLNYTEEEIYKAFIKKINSTLEFISK